MTQAPCTNPCFQLVPLVEPSLPITTPDSYVIIDHAVLGLEEGVEQGGLYVLGFICVNHEATKCNFFIFLLIITCFG